MFSRREVVAAGAALGVVAAPAGSWATPRRLAVTTSDGVVVDVRERPGPGRPIILVHGLGQSHLIWEPLLRSLGSSHHVVAYDLRGHGGSGKPVQAEAYTEGRRWADELRAVVEPLLPRAPVLVGWSLGGIVLSHYVARYGASDIGGLVLLGAVAIPAPELFTDETRALLPRLGATALEDRIAAARAFLGASFARAPEAALQETMLASGMVVPPEAYRAIARLGPDATWLDRVRVPALVVHGLRDRLVSPGMGRRVAAAVPGARLRLYEGVGHGPMVDAPARLAVDMLSFLGSLA